MRRARTGFSRRWRAPTRRARYDIVLNVQGDLPTIDAADIRAALAPLADPAVDIATLAAEIVRAGRAHQPERGEGGRLAGFAAAAAARSTSPARPRRPATGRSTTTSGSMPIAAPRSKRFVALPPSPLELREKLEQLRALEAGMRIDVAIVGSVPLGVDTPEDLERARELLSRSRVDERSAGEYRNGHDQSQESRIPGRAGGEFPPRDPRSLSEGGGHALRDLRGRVRGDRVRRGRPRHDPDRELGRGTGRRHPSSDAGCGAAHRRRALHAGAPPAAGGEGRDARRHQDRRKPRACARAMPQGDPRSSASRPSSPPTPPARRARLPRPATRRRAAIATRLAAEIYKLDDPRRGHRGRVAQHHPLHRARARSQLGEERHRRR